MQTKHESGRTSGETDAPDDAPEPSGGGPRIEVFIAPRDDLERHYGPGGGFIADLGWTALHRLLAKMLPEGATPAGQLLHRDVHGGAWMKTRPGERSFSGGAHALALAAGVAQPELEAAAEAADRALATLARSLRPEPGEEAEPSS